MADALNRRLHRETTAADAPTVTGARGHLIAEGDLILTRHNDVSIPLRDEQDPTTVPSPVRNGQRWSVLMVNDKNGRVAARRLDDNVLGVFPNDYVREHITHGYAVTVHSAQGVTADTAHAVLGENAVRRLLYVAMTRGRNANTAHIYQRAGEGHEYGHRATDAKRAERGTGYDAADMLHGIVANDPPMLTAHDYSAGVSDTLMPGSVRDVLAARIAAGDRRARDYQAWTSAREAFVRDTERARVQRLQRTRSRGTDYGLEL